MTAKNNLQPSYSLHIVPTFIPIGHVKAVKPYCKGPLTAFHLNLLQRSLWRSYKTVEGSFVFFFKSLTCKIITLMFTKYKENMRGDKNEIRFRCG